MKRLTAVPKGELALVVYVLVGLCLVLLVHLALASFLENSATSPAARPHKQVKLGPGFPVRLEIPKINVSANLDYVGLTSDGALAAPDTPMSAGWYDKGPRPGEKGSAVIDGHFGWRDNIPAVFDNLSTLQKGDKIYVVDENDRRIAFVVRESIVYGSDGAVPAVFRSSDGKAHLNLITCEGTWNELQQSYSNRLVVFTDMVTR